MNRQPTDPPLLKTVQLRRELMHQEFLKANAEQGP